MFLKEDNGLLLEKVYLLKVILIVRQIFVIFNKIMYWVFKTYCNKYKYGNVIYS